MGQSDRLQIPVKNPHLQPLSSWQAPKDIGVPVCVHKNAPWAAVGPSHTQNHSSIIPGRILPSFTPCQPTHKTHESGRGEKKWEMWINMIHMKSQFLAPSILTNTYKYKIPKDRHLSQIFKHILTPSAASNWRWVWDNSLASGEDQRVSKQILCF